MAPVFSQPFSVQLDVWYHLRLSVQVNTIYIVSVKAGGTGGAGGNSDQIQNWAKGTPITVLLLEMREKDISIH